ncbi:HPr kinase/phosphorylase [Paracoccus saliphilus]|uniref:Hpr(Ser) kinase/phosphatase n=1 Tax=Paracoccus saliphilus TaxID=405559 RepID=A0AA45W6T1_9RHOB|nr:HPr kinase/phosphatase C-terminal domain-containing protein [Paracoccus saliphilus]SIT03910.1 Hpr(Ser) kinase/phosphatase [Paracoccus saliphilus]
MIRTEQLHGTAVALDGRGLLILGPSGSGKSTLAMQLMAVGAALVSDDRTDLHREGDRIIAEAPATLSGRIEARGVGILHATAAGPVALSLVVDLGQSEDMRLPLPRYYDLLGTRLPLALGPYRSHLYAALRQCLLAGRAE